MKIQQLFLLLATCFGELCALLRPRGPFEVPFLGSADFVYRLARGQPLPDIMRTYKKMYGDIIRLKNGPIRQYWVTDAEGDVASDLLNTLECSGRSQLQERAFGNEFTFLIRSVREAREIRKKQREWIRQRGSPPRISRAVEAAFPALEAVFLQGGKREGIWDQDAVCQHSVRALLGTLIGGPSRQPDPSTDSDSSSGGGVAISEGWLTDPELQELQQNTAAYRRRGPRGRKAYAEDVSSTLRTALQRSGCVDKEMDSAQTRVDALPILVGAIVGGSEIYPILLHWAMRHLAVSPGLQRVLREDCRSAAPASKEPRSLSYGSLIQKFVTYVAWAHPYTVAIGPPRKLTDDVIVSANIASSDKPQRMRDVTLEREAIMFIMHPGLDFDWNAKFLTAHNESTRRVLTLKEACDIRQSAEDAAAEVRQCKSTSWPMFGMGERACTAPEMSVSFVASMLCAVLSKYEVGIAPEYQQCTVKDLFEYEHDGAMLLPKRSDIRITLTPVCHSRNLYFLLNCTKQNMALK